MPSTTVASATFSSRHAADQAIQRLLAGGFARNSIDLHRHDDDEGYDLEVHTRRENLKRVERLMHTSAPMYAVRQAGSGALQTARSHPVLLLGAGILAGFVIYNLIPRGEAESGEPHQPGHSRRTRSHGRHRG